MAARLVLSLVAALLLAGCVGDTRPPEPGTPSGASAPAGVDTGEEVPSALDDPAHATFPAPLIDLEHLVSGGPPPDGIPPIDQPAFEPAESVDWLQDDEPVLSLTVGEETRAYPLQIMTWHEIVNDTVGGEPVAVTYCPLCNSGVAFHRQVDGAVLDFGTSGMLYADNLVMYDRQTESLWPQLTGQASVGALTGTQLTAIPMGVVGWSQFVAAHPDAPVLTRDTGHVREYGRNPYPGYDDPDGWLLVEPPDGRDPRLPVKERVIGVRFRGRAVAVPRRTVAETGTVTVEHAGQRVVLWHVPGQRSALDDDTIAGGEEIGSVGVFTPRVGGRWLTFAAESGRIHDVETGSRWNVLGEAVAGPLRGRRLRPVTHLDTFWFAWVAFQPDTTVRR